MSRLKVETPDRVQLTVEKLYKDLERHIIASPPGLCPVDLQLSFLKVCQAQTCGNFFSSSLLSLICSVEIP